VATLNRQGAAQLLPPGSTFTGPLNPPVNPPRRGNTLSRVQVVIRKPLRNGRVRLRVFDIDEQNKQTIPFWKQGYKIQPETSYDHPEFETPGYARTVACDDIINNAKRSTYDDMLLLAKCWNTKLE
jgi:hypothetical protein